MNGIVVFLGAISLAIATYMVIKTIFNIVFMPKITVLQRMSDVETLDKLKENEEKNTASITKQLADSAVNAILEVIETIIPSNATALRNMEKQLSQAGMNISARRYSALTIFRMLLMAAAFTAGAVMLGYTKYVFFAFITGIYLGFTVSRFSLTGRLKKRKEEIYHQLPEVMDLLSVSVAAGLGFDQAIAYVVEKSKGALIEELDITRKEMTLGVTRKDALEALADRCNNMELNTFVTAVVQSEQMGANINNILQVQSANIRETHKQHIEEKAQRLPIILLLPLVLFIFPNVFIVILGPAVIGIMGTF
jgi:type II secretion system protein F domain protein